MQNSTQTHLKISNGNAIYVFRLRLILIYFDHYKFMYIVQSVGLWQNKHKNLPLKCLLIAPSCINKWSEQRSCRYMDFVSYFLYLTTNWARIFFHGEIYRYEKNVLEVFRLIFQNELLWCHEEQFGYITTVCSLKINVFFLELCIFNRKNTIFDCNWHHINDDVFVLKIECFRGKNHISVIYCRIQTN